MESYESQGSDVEDSDPVVTLKTGVNIDDLISSNGVEFEVNLSDIPNCGMVLLWLLLLLFLLLLLLLLLLLMLLLLLNKHLNFFANSPLAGRTLPVNSRTIELILESTPKCG